MATGDLESLMCPELDGVRLLDDHGPLTREDHQSRAEEVSGQVERLDRVDQLAVELERFAAGRQDGHGGPGHEQRRQDLRRFGEHVLAVVDDEAACGPAHRGAERLLGRARGRGRAPDGRQDDVGDRLAALERREVDEPHAVGEPVGCPVGDLDGQPRLARPRGPGESDQPVDAEQLVDPGQVGLAAHQTPSSGRAAGPGGPSPRAGRPVRERRRG
jgi:hypothetical protein